MSNATKPLEIKSEGPEYVGWRGELLTELALTRLAKIADVEIYKPGADQGYDFVIGTADGLFVFIQTQSFSSNSAGIKEPQRIDELRWKVPMDTIDRARKSRSPVLFFLFDADTDHGRFIRLDTLGRGKTKAAFETIAFPRQSIINEENLLKMLADLKNQA
jgi:hypothetical protein